MQGGLIERTQLHESVEGLAQARILSRHVFFSSPHASKAPPALHNMFCVWRWQAASPDGASGPDSTPKQVEPLGFLLALAQHCGDDAAAISLLQRLPLADRVSLGMVSRRWRRLAGNPAVCAELRLRAEDSFPTRRGPGSPQTTTSLITIDDHRDYNRRDEAARAALRAALCGTLRAAMSQAGAALQTLDLSALNPWELELEDCRRDSPPPGLTLMGWIHGSAAAASLQRLSLPDGVVLFGTNCNGDLETVRGGLLPALPRLRSLSCAVRLETHQPEAADVLRCLPSGGEVKLKLVVVPGRCGRAQRASLPALAKALAEAASVAKVTLQRGYPRLCMSFPWRSADVETSRFSDALLLRLRRYPGIREVVISRSNGWGIDIRIARTDPADLIGRTVWTTLRPAQEDGGAHGARPPDASALHAPRSS